MNTMTAHNPMNLVFANPLMDTDSYKACHWMTYPPGTEYVELYLESRGGDYDKTLWFGLNAILKSSFTTPITHDDVDEMEELFAWHGEPFFAEGWHRLVDKHGGRLPLRIRAVREGLAVPTHQVLAVVSNTDPEFYWLPAYFETALMRVWYTTTVATLSWQVKQFIREALMKTSDNAEAVLPSRLHDFGSRGVSSRESAALGGLAHLVSFQGTDTVLALKAAKVFYGADKAGFSIPATEHSSIISWGREHEFDAYRNVLRHFGKPNAVFACVSDSYDIYRAITEGWGGELREELLKSGAILVIRPDSGEPTEVVPKCLELMAQAFGVDTNSKGYKVLRQVRLIQGDGMNPKSIRALMQVVLEAGFSAENIAFGMGGALLQKVDRDTQKFALKCCAIRRDGTWHDTYKDPITDPGKASKHGRLTLLRHIETGEFRSAHPDEANCGAWRDVLHTVFENGVITKEWSFDDIRKHADRPF